MGPFITCLGIIVIAIGTALMCWGNTITSDNYQKEMTILIVQQAALIKVNQERVTREVVTKESDIKLIIYNLTKIEKWDLLNCVRDPTTLSKDGAARRMLMDYMKEIDPKFMMLENQLQAPMDSLVRKGLILWNNKDAVVTVTPLGAQVIEVLLRDKIYPFDFDHKYLRK